MKILKLNYLTENIHCWFKINILNTTQVINKREPLYK